MYKNIDKINIDWILNNGENINWHHTPGTCCNNNNGNSYSCISTPLFYGFKDSTEMLYKLLTDSKYKVALGRWSNKQGQIDTRGYEYFCSVAINIITELNNKSISEIHEEDKKRITNELTTKYEKQIKELVNNYEKQINGLTTKYEKKIENLFVIIDNKQRKIDNLIESTEEEIPEPKRFGYPSTRKSKKDKPLE